MQIIEIDPQAWAVIERYLSLNIGEKKVVTPYYINSGHIKDLRVMVGKGSPTEIEMETRIWAQLKGLDLNSMSAEEIRDFMRQRRIGVDCSGFVFHVLASMNKKLKFPKPTLWRRFKFWLRPAENFGADIITSELNTKKVDLNDIRPGDLIRSKTPRLDIDHVMLVTKVHLSNSGLPEYFEYAHSSGQFGKASGVRIGGVVITNPSGELKDQQWQEQDEQGNCPALSGLLIDYNDNGLRRLI